MRRSNTKDKLELITNKNSGKRLSLVMDDEYDSSSEDSNKGTIVAAVAAVAGSGAGEYNEHDEIDLIGKGKANGNVEKAPFTGNLPLYSVGASSAISRHAESGSASLLLSQPKDYTVNEVIATIKDINNKFDKEYRLLNQKKRKFSSKRKDGVSGSETVSEVELGTQVAEEQAQSDLKERFRSKFSDIEHFSKETTIFDSEYFKESEFFGIYILFWLGTGFLMLQNVVHSYLVSIVPFHQTPIVLLLRQDLLKVALTDAAMYFSSYGAFFIQYICLQRWLEWKYYGKTIHLVFEFAYIVFWIHFSMYCQYPWIARVFLTLHGFVFLMKMHSYGYYNGYLWNTLNEMKFSERYLNKVLDGKTTIPKGYEEECLIETLENSINFCKFELEYQSRATILIEKGSSKNLQNIDTKALNRKVEFPSNITLYNFFEFSLYPTVVYTLNFTRTKRIRWSYVFEKCVAIFGIIFLMVLVAQNMMYPTVLKAIEYRELPVHERIIPYCFILLDMIPPFLMVYLFTFFLIWDFILNAIAELSRFADRDFYGPWWSCTDWSEFARIWNRPVHKFLLRHVYHSSLSTLQLNKAQSSLVTFVISSVVHELVMFVIFGKLRGYLLLLQMSQLPLIMLSNTKYMKDKKVLGNVICWFGFMSGPSMVCTAYLVF